MIGFWGAVGRQQLGYLSLMNCFGLIDVNRTVDGSWHNRSSLHFLFSHKSRSNQIACGTRHFWKKKSEKIFQNPPLKNAQIFIPSFHGKYRYANLCFVDTKQSGKFFFCTLSYPRTLVLLNIHAEEFQRISKQTENFRSESSLSFYRYTILKSSNTLNTCKVQDEIHTYHFHN